MGSSRTQADGRCAGASRLVHLVIGLVVGLLAMGKAAALQPVAVRDDNLKLPQSWKACGSDAQCVRLPNGCGETSVNAAHLSEARKQSFTTAGDPATLNCSGTTKPEWSYPMCLSGSCTLVVQPTLPQPALPVSMAEAQRFLAKRDEYEACSKAEDCTLAADQCGTPRAVNRGYLDQFEQASRISGTAVSCVVPKAWSKAATAGAVSCVENRCTIRNPNVLYPNCSTCSPKGR